MTPARPYTPETLAERWQCSAETVRQLVHRGELPGFRVGRMIRIARAAVEEYESCRQTSASSDFAADSAPSGTDQTDAATAISLRHAPERKPRPRR